VPKGGWLLGDGERVSFIMLRMRGKIRYKRCASWRGGQGVSLSRQEKIAQVNFEIVETVASRFALSYFFILAAPALPFFIPSILC